MFLCNGFYGAHLVSLVPSCVFLTLAMKSILQLQMQDRRSTKRKCGTTSSSFVSTKIKSEFATRPTLCILTLLASSVNRLPVDIVNNNELETEPMCKEQFNISLRWPKDVLVTCEPFRALGCSHRTRICRWHLNIYCITQRTELSSAANISVILLPGFSSSTCSETQARDTTQMKGF